MSFLSKLSKPFKSIIPNHNKDDQKEEDLENIAAREQKLFSYQTLATATQNFHLDHKLGEGGFGPVYKGKLEDGREIAVKKLSQTSNQGKKEFMNEAKLLARVQHRNVVNLLGYCIHGSEKLLVYEYLPHQSLDKFLFNTKGQFSDIQGMEQLLETMKEQGFEPDVWTQVTICKHYIHGGFTEKAEAVLKDMEGSNLNENRKACQALLTLYADLGKDDEVESVWKICDPNPRMDECLSAIEAYGKLGKVEQAEAVFEKMAKKWKKLSSRSYTTLLKVYADHKMLAKGKELTKRMADSGCRIGPWTWDALVELYVEAGEVEKADSIIFKASQQNQEKPLFSSYIRVMDQYAKRGDIHNAEKMLHRLKQVGYAGRLRQYQILLDAYINAKVPAYGFRERMKADDVFPNKTVAAKLAQVDAFKKTAISELLD